MIKNKGAWSAIRYSYIWVPPVQGGPRTKKLRQQETSKSPCARADSLLLRNGASRHDRVP